MTTTQMILAAVLILSPAIVGMAHAFADTNLTSAMLRERLSTVVDCRLGNSTSIGRVTR